MSVSLIIPAFNEQARIEATLEQYSQHFNTRYPDAYEIIVVANGCTDQTVALASQFASLCGHVRVIDIPQAIGKGRAVLEGFRQARGEYVAFADADCATSPLSLIGLIEQLSDADIVIGSRWLPTSRVLLKQPLMRRIYSRSFNLIVRILYRLPYRDTQCGAKAFRAAAANRLSRVIRESGWTFDVALLVCARYFQYRIRESPVVWQDQKGSRIRFRTTFLEVLGSLWRLKRLSIPQEPSDKISLVQAEEATS